MKGKKTGLFVVLGGIAAIGIVIGLAAYFEGGDTTYFYPFDAYVALPADTSYNMVLSYYHNKEGNSIAAKSITKLSLVGAEGSKVILNNEPESTTRKFREMWYDNWSLDFCFSKKGLYHVTELEITGQDGSVTKLPIGDWYFDVGDTPPGEYEMIYSNPAVTTADAYCYSFDLPKGAVLKRLQYGPESSLEGEALEVSGRIPLELPEDRVSLIRPKLDFEVNGNVVSTYGSNGYSGFSRVYEPTYR